MNAASPAGKPNNSAATQLPDHAAATAARKALDDGIVEFRAESYKNAQSLFANACDAGLAEGCSNFGFLYMRKGGYRNLKRAADNFTKACDGGFAEGCFNLAAFYASGEVLAKDLGVFTFQINGELVFARDSARAASLHVKACEGGYAKGCSFVAGMYLSGDGVALNYATAADYARRALAIDPNLEEAIHLLEVVEQEPGKAK